MSDILNLTNEAASLRSSVQISKDFKATDIIVDNHFRLIIHRNEIPVYIIPRGEGGSSVFRLK